jgi:hypothetical protein
MTAQNNQPKAIEVTKELTVFNISISTWQAKKVLKAEDLPDEVRDKIPPAELVNLGSKKTFDREYLREVNKIRQQTINGLSKKGIHIFGPTSFGVPSSIESEVYDFIQEKQAEFNKEVGKIILRYDEVMKNYVARFPEYKDWILQAAPTANEVDKKYKFNFTVFKIAPSSLEQKGKISSLSDTSDSLGEQLFEEISKASTELLDKSVYSRKDGKVSRNAITATRKLRDKMDSLSFLDLRVLTVLDFVDEKLKDLGTSGSVEGSMRDSLISALSLMSSKERMLKFGKEGEEEEIEVKSNESNESNDSKDPTENELFF